MVKATKKQNNFAQWMISIVGALTIIGIVVLAFFIFGDHSEESKLRKEFPSLKNEEVLVYQFASSSEILNMLEEHQTFFVFLGAKNFKNSDAIAIRMNQSSIEHGVPEVLFLDLAELEEDVLLDLRMRLGLLVEDLPTVLRVKNGTVSEKSHTYAGAYETQEEEFDWFVKNSIE